MSRAVMEQALEAFDSMLGRKPERVEQAITALRAALAEQAQPEPPGWRMVPVEPTEDMLDVMHDRIRILCNPSEQTASIRNDREVWALMLAAAPEAPTPPAPQPLTARANL